MNKHLSFKPKWYLAYAAAIGLAAGCASYRQPYFTSPDQIVQLKPGMSPAEVKAKLGIEPYDVYHVQEDGSTVYTYNYRVKNRTWGGGGLDEEIGQTSGQPYYDEPGRLYVLFSGNKLASLVTDAGRSRSKDLIIVKNTIQLISKEQVNKLTSNNFRHIIQVGSQTSKK